ncbi:MAG: hypothetical protein FD188_3358 [Ignavibacteria bacterium]|nr:MAG: hypothetical protein FD188_3358 [Ignavibacteria bacterium]
MQWRHAQKNQYERSLYFLRVESAFLHRTENVMQILNNKVIDLIALIERSWQQVCGISENLVTSKVDPNMRVVSVFRETKEIFTCISLSVPLKSHLLYQNQV